MLRRMRKNRGFTLIELMIVVAIVGILAILAIFGVRKYLANAKTAEATNSIGAINQAAVAGYERENAAAELKTGASVGTTHALCTSSTIVPAGGGAGVKNIKYTPNPALGSDYHSGGTLAGWTCLKYEMNQAQYYAYQYTAGAASGLGNKAGAPAPGVNGWHAEAVGDLNGDGVLSSFVTGGQIVGGVPITMTQIAVLNAEE